MTTVRFLIAIANSFSWPLCQLDINNAVLHGFLNETIYMHIPPGLKGAKPGQVCKLVCAKAYMVSNKHPVNGMLSFLGNYSPKVFLNLTVIPVYFFKAMRIHLFVFLFM